MLLFTARPRIMRGGGRGPAARPRFGGAPGPPPGRRRFPPGGRRPAPTSNPAPIATPTPAPTRQKPAGHKNCLQGAGTGPQTKPSCGRFRRAPPAAAMRSIAGPAALLLDSLRPSLRRLLPVRRRLQPPPVPPDGLHPQPQLPRRQQQDQHPEAGTQGVLPQMPAQ